MSTVAPATIESPPAPPPRSEPGRSLARSTLAVSSLNLVSRITGLVRVVAMSAALGATALGDTYQAANLVSNIVFELLAGGLLSAALVPTFVGLIDRGRRHEAAHLAGSLLGVAVAALSAVVAVGVLLAPRVMGLLTLGVDDPGLREAQVRLGTFLLWFFLPQVLLYAVGAVATALLHADRRFVAAAVAPVFNNLVVIMSMAAFWALHDGDPTLALGLADKLVLALGATGGVLAMTVVPVVAVWRGGLGLRARWVTDATPVGPLLRTGLWAAGHLGLFQAFALVTVVVANQVSGGVVAYHVAFTLFLLPYALLANPLTTTLYPRLAADAAAGRTDQLATDVAWGLRTLAFVLVPATFLIAALARPALEVVRLGNLDLGGADLVATATGAYAAGLVGYAAFFLLTRACYAIGDTRTPTVVNLLTVTVGAAAAAIGGTLVDGSAVLVVLGLVHAGVVTVGSALLLLHLGRRVGRLHLQRAVARDVLLGAVGGLAAWSIVGVIGSAGRTAALGSLVLGGVLGTCIYAAGQIVFGAEELRSWRSGAPDRTTRPDPRVQ